MLLLRLPPPVRAVSIFIIELAILGGTKMGVLVDLPPLAAELPLLLPCPSFEGDISEDSGPEAPDDLTCIGGWAAATASSWLKLSRFDWLQVGG